MPFEVEICESDPEVNLDEWEHVSLSLVVVLYLAVQTIYLMLQKSKSARSVFCSFSR